MQRSFALSAFRSQLIITSLFLALFVLAPKFASADVAAIKTAQLLPVGGNSCAQVTVTNLAAHVYGGTLQSFDLAITDPRAVGVGGTVGNNTMTVHSFSRWSVTQQGMVIHADTPTTAVGTGLPVSITLMSAQPNGVVCATVVSFIVKGSHETVAAGYTQSSGATHTPSTGTTGYVAHETVATKKAQPSTGPVAVTAAAKVANSVVTSNIAHRITSTCASGSAYRLWFVLLLVYLAIVTVVAFAEPWFVRKSVVATVAAIMVPLLMLLGFWYLSAQCRAASWVPVAACVIAIIGLFLTFREDVDDTEASTTV